MKMFFRIFAAVLLLTCAVAVIWRDGVATYTARAWLGTQGLSAVRFEELHVGLSETSVGHITMPEGKLDALTARYALPRMFPLSLEGKSLALRKSGIRLSVARLMADITSATDGAWQMENIQLEGTGLPLPPMQGQGKLTAEGVTGAVSDRSGAYHVGFEYAPAQLVLKDVRLPWEGGTLAVREARWPLDKDAAVRIPVDVRQIPLETLLALLTRQTVPATGTVSGTLTAILGPGTQLALEEGSLLKAGQAGVINMPPEVIPGDNPQVGMTRDILKNFHYSTLTVGVVRNPSGLALNLALEGNNPDMYNGRAVKLNVTLRGDVLDFLRQNVILQTEPEALLNQE